MTRTSPVAAALLAVGLTASAPAQTWTGAANDGGNWNDAANWTPATVPNSATADAVFGSTGVGNIVLLNSVTARSLTFTNPSGSYGISSTSAIISGNLTAITVGPAVTGTETINLANVAAGSLLFGTLGVAINLTITNNSASSSNSLVIGPNTVIGTPFAGGIMVAGVGNTQISGSYANSTGGNQIIGGLALAGPGTLSLNGDGRNLLGGFTLGGGQVNFDFTSSTTAKIGSGGLVSSGGTLNVIPNASTAATQNFASTAFNAGETQLGTSASGTVPTFGLGAMSRAAGATFSYQPGNGGQLGVTTTTGNTNGLWGNGPGFAASQTNWLTNNGSGLLVNLAAGPTNVFSSGTNTDVSGSITASNFTTNSLRFNTANTNLNIPISSNNTLQSGGILVSTAQGATISGDGFLGSGVNELIVHNVFDGNLTINCRILASSGLTSADGFLTLGGLNSGLTGPININRGILIVTAPSAVSSASAIRFNDNRVSSQSFLVEFGDGSSGEVDTPIQFASYSNSAAGSFANQIGNFSPNSRVTLGGVISSLPGSVTPINMQNNNASGINLTGANTFTGDIQISSCTLGINSNASLGNPVNTLYLDMGNTTAGGLEFLNSGITVARAVVIQAVTRIVSDGGDVNTISGPVSGSALLVKDGTGTLVLSGANTQPGVTINAGTVSVAADANIGAANAAISINSGATLSLTGTLANSRPIAIGPLSGNVVGSSTIDVASGQTLTLNGVVSGAYGALVKTSPGTLVLANTVNTYGGGTTVQAGGLQVAADGSLGTAGTPVTVAGAGTLTYNGSTSTTRTFNLNSGTLTVPTGVTLMLNGASVFGGFLRGAGTFAAAAGTTITGSSTATSTAVNVAGAASFTNFSNSGALTVTAGLAATPTVVSNIINQGSGTITVGASSIVNAADFQTYGTVTLSPGTMAAPTQITNTGTSNLFFNGGSRTFLSIPAHAGQFDAGIDLHGQNAVVAGGLLVNNGYVVDSVGAGQKTIIADFGSVVKGAGFYQNSVQTINGGKFQSGNSPGRASFGSFTFGPGGVSNYVFAIDDATGAAGPSPDANDRVSGWGLVKTVQRLVGGTTTTGDFAWTATATNKLTVSLDTLVNPTTVGTDIAGPMADFDPTRTYSWLAASWAGNYDGPTDPAALNASTVFDTSGFQNPIAGAFGWSLDTGGHSLSLTYTPSAVPEPGTLALTAMVGIGWVRFWRRRWLSGGPSTTLSA